MPITINVSMVDAGVSHPVANTTLHESHITIGRGEECTLALDDPKKHVSRVHAEIEEKGGSYWMKVVSKVNPVFVNKQRHNFGERVALATGDFLTVGTYRLELLIPVEKSADATMLYRNAPGAATETTDSALAQATFIATPTPAAKQEPAVEQTYIPPSTREAVEQTYIPPSAQEAVEQTYIPPSAQGVAEQTYIPPPTQGAIPADTAEADLSDELTFVRRPEKKEAAPQPTAKPAPAPEEDFSDELTLVRRPEKKKAAPQPTAKPAPVPEEDLSGEMTLVRRPEKKEAAPPPTAKPAPAPEEDLSGEMTLVRRPEKKEAAPQPTAKPAPASEEDLSGEMTLVRRPTTEATNPQGKVAPAQPAGSGLSEQITYVRPLTNPPPASAANAAIGADVGAQRALQAFFQGAGLAPVEIADPEAFLRDSGMMVRAAVEGIMLLLAARNAALQELGITLPPVSAGVHVNNPLKSMSDPREVVAFLLDPHKRTNASHDPVQAFGDACVDLRAHEMALLASLRAAALKAVLSVDPLEFDRDQGKNLGTFGMNRKSKLWDLFVAHHNQLAQGSQDGFKAQFGRDLTSAYVTHIRRLRGGR